jgi:ketosteroid isomerase-like protein
VKRCPTCNKTFTDRQLTFCVDDGTPLVEVDAIADETTVVTPSARGDETRNTDEPDGAGPSRGLSDGPGERDVPPYQPPGSYRQFGVSAQGKRRTWPWVLGILAVLVAVFTGLGIAAVIFIPRMTRGLAERNASNSNANIGNANVSRVDNSNRNSNGTNSNSSANAADENENNNDNSENEAPPTNEQAVLADLKKVEDEWTVANINADKKKLIRILADDYVATIGGRAQGKAEYLNTIERDTAIQHWEFEDLKVSLKSDRASLTGTLRLELKDQQGLDHQAAYHFVDKFVWRDGRWQATSSEVNALKE